jgi:hypothetical protein
MDAFLERLQAVCGGAADATIGLFGRGGMITQKSLEA